jgi:hypothetical protein
MNKEFIPYEQALALKELGFDEPCLASWNFYTKELNYNSQPSIFTSEDVIQLPLYQQAFRWFREKYPNIEFSLPLKKQKDLGIFWGVFIQTENDNFGKSYGSNFKTYEEAELACFIKLIEIVKNNNND